MEIIYEVETRFYFKDKEEAYTALPFLDSCLDIEVEWETFHYGIDLYKKDIILRINDAKSNNQRIITLGYKEPDLGEVVNIRKEYNEEITNGIEGSRILHILGRKKSVNSPAEVKEELKRLGHHEFMYFTGRNLAGEYKPLDLHLKLMYCKALAYPLLLEIEKEARTIEEAATRENEILDFIKKYNLEGRMVKKEPPTLLYKSLF
ncbi:MAG: hypothetical protein ACOYVK_07285 [Bacillota bacterium]